MSNEHQRLYALTEHILALMQENQGAISFQTWMDAALYTPKLGYYESEEVFGKAGDFTTAAAMGPWLAIGLAETIHKSWLALGKPASWTLIEQGGGSGDLMCNTLHELARLGLTPTQSIAVESSAQLRQRQQENYAKQQLEIQQVSRLQDVPTTEHAIVFSNELPDAFPVQSFIWQDRQAIERGVDWSGETFVWKSLEAIQVNVAQNIQQHWPEGYISEFNPLLQAWQQDIANTFERGVVLTVDYGYSQQEYYRASRIEGTIMGHYKHQVIDNVLKLSPGVCDITAHIDFSTLRKAGQNAGLDAIAYTTQGAWLAQSQHIQQRIQEYAAHPNLDSIADITHAKRLMLPNGMGESFKLLIQSKGVHQKDSQILINPAFDRLTKL